MPGYRRFRWGKGSGSDNYEADRDWTGMEEMYLPVKAYVEKINNGTHTQPEWDPEPEDSQCL